MEKKGKRNAWQASLVQKTHEITRVSKRHIRRVINGEFENQRVMNVYMELVEGENKVLEQVKALVPFE